MGTNGDSVLDGSRLNLIQGGTDIEVQRRILRGDTGPALQLLDRAVAHGRGNLAWIEHDEDLAALRGEPGFKLILDRIRALSRASG